MGSRRHRTVSLGIGQIAADKAAEQPTSETVSSRVRVHQTGSDLGLRPWSG